MNKLKQQVSDNLSTTPRHETQSSNTVPVDLLIEIFSLVPAKSIARYCCLSKFWASILCRHDFTDLFLTKSLSRPRLFFTFEDNRKWFFYSSPQPQISDDNSTLVATPYKSLPQYVPSDICTHVCGLFLLQGWRSKLRVVCNPATGQFLTLPKVPLKKKEKEEVSITYFGYDPIGKQFKVLCIMTSSSRVEINTHRVLTLESGKRSWRPVECNKSILVDHIIRGQICINGVLYFRARSGLSSVIVCFDVRSEKFVFIDVDKDMERVNHYFVDLLTLFNYKGKLGIHHWNAGLYGKELVLWVLEDTGNHKWSKHIYVLSPCGKKMIKENRFIGVTCTGELVFFAPVVLSNPNFRVFFYNLETDTFTFTRLNIQGSEKFKHRHTFLDYVEILKFM